MLHMLNSDTASYLIKGKSPLSAGAVLVSNNHRHYERIEAPLLLENWV